MGTKPWKRQVSPAAGDVFASVRTFRGTGKERKMNMKQFARSAIALFCVLVLCMGLVPVYTFADEGEVSAPAETSAPAPAPEPAPAPAPSVQTASVSTAENPVVSDEPYTPVLTLNPEPWEPEAGKDAQPDESKDA